MNRPTLFLAAIVFLTTPLASAETALDAQVPDALNTLDMGEEEFCLEPETPAVHPAECADEAFWFAALGAWAAESLFHGARCLIIESLNGECNPANQYFQHPNQQNASRAA